MSCSKRADRQTERRTAMTRLRLAFRYFAKAPKNECHLSFSELIFQVVAFEVIFVACTKILSVSGTILRLRIGQRINCIYGDSEERGRGPFICWVN